MLGLPAVMPSRHQEMPPVVVDYLKAWWMIVLVALAVTVACVVLPGALVLWWLA